MPWDLGIYLTAVAGFHLLVGAGGSWYLLEICRGFKQSVLQVQAVQRKENRFMSKREITSTDSEARGGPGVEIVRSEAPSELLRELVAHLRQNRTQLREEWVVGISETRVLPTLTKEEIFAEATSVYDSYVEALETEAFEALQAYA